MSFPNHVAGGMVFTGIFSSISGVNILTSEWYILMTVFASVFPDIDHPSSPVGKLFLPISKWLNRNYGHRTITHSYIFLGATTFAVGYLESLFLNSSALTIIFFFGMTSHQIFDMMTVSGVAVFYPFSNAIAVIPGDESLRFNSSNRKVEVTIFSFFCLCFAFLIPLFETGFWTQYNRAFGTPKHLHSEFSKSDDLLEVEYTYRIGSQEYTGTGYVIETSQYGCKLIEAGEWLKIDKSDMIVKNLIPSHTGKKWAIQDINFVGIGIDSLNSLLDSKSAIKTEIHSNNEFGFLHSGKEKQGRVVKADYFTNAKVRELAPEIKKDQIQFQPSPKIKTLQSRIQNIKNKHQQQLTEYEQEVAEKRKLEEQISKEQNLFNKEKLVQQLKTMSLPQEPILDEAAIQLLEAQINEVKLADQLEHQSKLQESEKEYLSKLPDDSHYTGFLKYVIIEN